MKHDDDWIDCYVKQMLKMENMKNSIIIGQMQQLNQFFFPFCLKSKFEIEFYLDVVNQDQRITKKAKSCCLTSVVG